MPDSCVNVRHECANIQVDELLSMNKFQFMSHACFSPACAQATDPVRAPCQTMLHSVDFRQTHFQLREGLVRRRSSSLDIARKVGMPCLVQLQRRRFFVCCQRCTSPSSKSLGTSWTTRRARKDALQLSSSSDFLGHVETLCSLSTTQMPPTMVWALRTLKLAAAGATLL